VEVVDQAGSQSNPALSPDGKTLAYVSNHESTGSDLWTVPLDGGSPTRQTRLGDVHTLEWNRNGSLLAFLSSSAETGGRHQVFVLSIAAGQVTRLTIDSDVSAPTWSPDGTRLAVNYRAGSRWSIGSMRADGSDFMDLTPDVADAFSPTWSPDGRSIAFTLPVGDEVDVAVVGAAGGTAQPFLVPRTAEFGATWTPDGRGIIYGSALPFDKLVQIDLTGILPDR
jgi:Tol biopolymer transport system component